MGIGAAVGIGYGMLLAKLQKDVLTGKRHCKYINQKIDDPEKKKRAISSCRINLMAKAISELKAARPKCKNVKNPEKCLKQVERGIKFYEKEILKVKQNMR